MTTATIKALFAIGFACCVAMPAAAQKHVALVLDNGGIQTVAPATPTSRIAEGLERMQYRVIIGRQQDRRVCGSTSTTSAARSKKDAEVALFYFKGVTLDSSGRNLLMSSSAAPGRPIDQQAVALDEIADLMTASRANVLLVDGGYANRTTGTRSLEAPLAFHLRWRRCASAAGSWWPLPTRPDGSAVPTPRTPSLKSWPPFSSKEDITSADLGRQLKQDVFERTRGSQLPWVRSDLGAVQLAALPTVPAAPLQTPEVPASIAVLWSVLSRPNSSAISAMAARSTAT